MTLESWTELVRRLTSTARFFPGVSPLELARGEARLAVRVPDDLRAVLTESNGIDGEHGLGLVWPLRRIVEDNVAFRSRPDFRELYMSFADLLFFADAGNGDQFAYAISAGEVRRGDVFVWNHENDSRTWIAADLRTYLEWWLSGKIDV